jgi:Fe-S-cluster containining protein
LADRAADVYFTWPDRRFKYECRGCGACCKGHGIGIDVVAGQLVQLVTKRPELAAFIRRRGDAITAFNPRDRCWFLADDGLCRVEIEDGRAAKPASCRLFPFNRVFRIGTTLVVDFNSVICPLAVVDDDGVTHREVLDEIATIQDPAIVGTQLPAAPALIAAERSIADVMFTHPLELASPESIDAPWTAQSSAPLTSALDVVTPAFEVLLGAPWTQPRPATLANAIALTPSMRFNELFGPRQYAPPDKIGPLLARMWLAWLGFAALGEKLAQRALGLQELTTLWSEQAPLMHAIARWDAIPVFKPGPVELPNVDPGNLVRGLGQKCVDNKQAKKPLGALVGAVMSGADPAARIAALRMADPILRAAF